MTQRDPRLGSGLTHLRELRGYRVTKEDSDPRGWAVMAPGGRRIGTVQDLVVDTAALRARYLEVELDRAALKNDESERRILVDVESAQLYDDRNQVHLPTTPPLVVPPIR